MKLSCIRSWRRGISNKDTGRSRDNRLRVSVALWIATPFSLAACASPASDIHDKNVGCSVPSAPKHFEKAVCEADADAIALFPGFFDPESRSMRNDGSPSTIAWLTKMLYDRDQTFGVGLPWRKLDQPRVRSVIVLVVARQTREGLLGESVAPMLAYARAHLSDSDPNVRTASLMIFGQLRDGTHRDALYRAALEAHTDQERMAGVVGLAVLCSDEARSDLRKLVPSLPTALKEIAEMNLRRNRGDCTFLHVDYLDH